MMFRLQCSTKVKSLFFLRREEMEQDKLASMSKVKKVETKGEKNQYNSSAIWPCRDMNWMASRDGLEQRASAARNDWMKAGQLSAAKADFFSSLFLFMKTKTSIFDLCFF